MCYGCTSESESECKCESESESERERDRERERDERERARESDRERERYRESYVRIFSGMDDSFGGLERSTQTPNKPRESSKRSLASKSSRLDPLGTFSSAEAKPPQTRNAAKTQ